MTDYPNREHKVADEAAKRRALAALDHMVQEIETLRTRITRDIGDGDDSQRLSSLMRDVTQHISILGALRDVRAWHALDQNEGTP